MLYSFGNAMLATFYINPTCWVIVVAGLLAWVRFALWLAEDVEKLRKQSLVLWRAIAALSVGLLVVLWILIPMFWLALPVSLLVTGGIVAWYWHLRVAELGPAGHLFRGALGSVGRLSRGLDQRWKSRQVTLTYLRSDDAPLPLPAAEDPLAAGLSMADQILVEAAAKHAEIIELVPVSEAYELRYIVDGMVYPQPNVERNIAESIIQSLKSIAGLGIEERRRPQQGAFKVKKADMIPTSWTIRTNGSTMGERLYASANEKGRWHYDLDQIGLAADQLAAVKSFLVDAQGVVLVAAPKQHGRTTTLYSMVRSHDAFTNSVQTLESTPQDDIEGATVNRFDPRNAESSYAKALQSIFLKDPNIVLSQQCPDTPTADVIARFGASGHRVYVGVTAFDTMAGLDYWLRIVSDKRAAVQSLRAIVAQRLVRLLCPTCKVSYQPDEATLRKLNLPVGRNLQSFKANTEPLVDARGNTTICPDCVGTGYRGRTGIFEVLLVNDEMKQAILGGANLQGVRALARKNNMMFLVEHGFRKFASSLTSIQEVARVLAPDRANPSAASGVMPATK